MNKKVKAGTTTVTDARLHSEAIRAKISEIDANGSQKAPPSPSSTTDKNRDSFFITALRPTMISGAISTPPQQQHNHYPNTTVAGTTLGFNSNGHGGGRATSVSFSNAHPPNASHAIHSSANGSRASIINGLTTEQRKFNLTAKNLNKLIALHNDIDSKRHTIMRNNATSPGSGAASGLHLGTPNSNKLAMDTAAHNNSLLQQQMESSVVALSDLIISESYDHYLNLLLKDNDKVCVCSLN